jgi:hypothetical protein
MKFGQESAGLATGGGRHGIEMPHGRRVIPAEAGIQKKLDSGSSPEWHHMHSSFCKMIE